MAAEDNETWDLLLCLVQKISWNLTGEEKKKASIILQKDF